MRHASLAAGCRRRCTCIVMLLIRPACQNPSVATSRPGPPPPCPAAGQALLTASTALQRGRTRVSAQLQ